MAAKRAGARMPRKGMSHRYRYGYSAPLNPSDPSKETSSPAVYASGIAPRGGTTPIDASASGAAPGNSVRSGRDGHNRSRHTQLYLFARR